MDKRIVLFIASLIFISGCSDRINYQQQFDIDFSEPEEQISVPAKGAEIYGYKGDIVIKTRCETWNTYSQRGRDTNSMDPTFDEGHIILACRLKNSTYQLQVGDIVVFNRKLYNPITHRIIDINGHNYTIKGDNLDGVEYVNKSQITHYILGVIY